MIRKEMIAEEWAYASSVGNLKEHYRESARNLLHYLILRKYDLREMQEHLSSLGISSIGHSERYTLTNLTNILHLLYLLDGKTPEDLESSGIRFSLNYPKSKSRLQENTVKLFGPEKEAGHTRIMVTLPSEAAEDYGFVKSLLKKGVEILRINCSHDQPEDWEKMITHAKKAEKVLGVKALIYMDLAGPKLRTGPVKEKKSDGKNKKKKKGPSLELYKGDLLEVHKAEIQGKQGKKGKPSTISTTLPEVFSDILPGQTIWFDDGKIGGVIKEVTEEKLLVEITNAAIDGSKLKGDKGINLPDTDIHLPSLTEYDLQTLPFVAKHADLVGYSFVRKPGDVKVLQKELKKLGREDVGIILKIETREAFDNLPLLIFRAMKSERTGIMIARGDLAVEVGWSRIAEVQEQIMWICEAAHMPYIWATQILETLAKSGVATRAEITDAALAARAECAMLNKGPYILDAVDTLRNVDMRMVAHHQKKMGALRPLHVAKRFFETKKAD
ncbi:MAG: pyruvate kinase [Saprospiraceae bacterium]